MTVKRVSAALVLVALGSLGACVAPVDEQPEVTTDDMNTDTQGLETPAELEVTPDSFDNACLTTTCKPGLQGDQYCTSLCGDVARCVSPQYNMGCGIRPCCVMM